MLAKIITYLFKREFYDSVRRTFDLPNKDVAFIENLREKKFLKLINHAKENVPYYSDKLKDVNKISDLHLVDFLTKKDIIENQEKLKSNNLDASRFLKNSTSGSTGTSTYFYSDRKNYNLKAALYRGDSWAGLRLNGKAMYLWGAERDINANLSLKDKIKRKIFLKKIIFSTYHMSQNDLKMYYENLLSFKPEVLISYPTPLFHFAEYIDEKKLTIPKLNGIITSAETLFPFQRTFIEKVFKTKIFNRYGCREVGHIASECSNHKGMHYNADRFIIEIVRPDGSLCNSGELGEIVITDLDNFVFPFIRYKIGDLAIKSDRKCPCGNNLPLLEKVEGRVFDLIYGSNGNVVGGTFWTLLRNKIKGWDKFQIIQHKKDELKIVVENNSEITENFDDDVKKIVKEKLGENMKVEIEIVEKIPLTKSGKHRWIISKTSPYEKE